MTTWDNNGTIPKCQNVHFSLNLWSLERKLYSIDKQFPGIISAPSGAQFVACTMCSDPHPDTESGEKQNTGFYLLVWFEPHLINITASISSEQMLPLSLRRARVSLLSLQKEVFLRASQWRGSQGLFWLSPTNDRDCFCIDSTSAAPNHIIKVLSPFQTWAYLGITDKANRRDDTLLVCFFLGSLNQFHPKLLC